MDKYLIRTIIITMTSIGQVEYRMHDQFTGIYRDGILFAKIHAEGFYLLNNPNNEYDPTRFVKLYNEDLLGKTLLSPQIWLSETFAKLTTV